MNIEFAYSKYVSLKLHFNRDDYDYFKYEGKVKISPEAYDERADKPYFKRACKLYSEAEYVNLLIANFIYCQESWIGDIVSDLGKSRLFEWKKIIQSIKYTFKQDLIYIEEYLSDNDLNFNELFKKSTPYPAIVKFCVEKSISLETFVILNKLLNFVFRVDKLIDERILWNKYKLLSVKYAPFIASDDLSSYKQILIEKFYTKSLTNTQIKNTI
jgi:hypothetical protein